MCDNDEIKEYILFNDIYNKTLLPDNLVFELKVVDRNDDILSNTATHVDINMINNAEVIDNKMNINEELNDNHNDINYLNKENKIVTVYNKVKLLKDTSPLETIDINNDNDNNNDNITIIDKDKISKDIFPYKIIDNTFTCNKDKANEMTYSDPRLNNVHERFHTFTKLKSNSMKDNFYRHSITNIYHEVDDKFYRTDNYLNYEIHEDTKDLQKTSHVKENKVYQKETSKEKTHDKEQLKEVHKPDTIVTSVIDFLERSKINEINNADIGLYDWIIRTQEEYIASILYLEKIKKMIKS